MRTYQKVLAVIALSGMCFAAAAPSEGEGAVKKGKKHRAKVEKMEEKAPCEACEAIKRLEEKVAAQQAEIDALKGAQPQPATADEQAREAAAAAKRAADDAAAAAAAANATANGANSAAAGAQASAAAASEQAQDAEKKVAELETPPYLHYKNIRITPGGFLEGATIWRQRAENADLLSSFSGIPYSNNSLAHMTEFRGSARQSRATLLAQGNVGDVKLTGYYEVDFLGAANTANENQSSSFNPRQRQLFVEASSRGWTLTGGQTWSLLTTNKQGIATRGEWVPTTINGQYVVGYTFARLMTARLAKTLDDGKATVAFSIENPATIFSPAASGLIVTGGTGAGGGMTSATTFTTNLAPDLIAKVAFDPSFGHFEIKALGRFFRDRIAGGSNNVNVGGGVGAAAIIPVMDKKVNLIAEGFVGRGTGRFGDSLQTDATFRPDGSISPIKNLRGVAGVEVHATPKLDWYLYAGDEYLGRDFFTTPIQTGYGNPNILATPPATGNAGCLAVDTAGAACSAATKNLLQADTGFWYTMYKGGYGMLRYGMEYNWTYKTTWQDASGVAPKQSESMAFTSFRYYIP